MGDIGPAEDRIGDLARSRCVSGPVHGPDGPQTPQRVTAPLDAVITGSGISRDEPSRLPDGRELAVLAWRMIAESFPAEASQVALTAVLNSFDRPVRKEEKGLRLEQLLEVMSKYVALDKLVSVYDIVASEVFNLNHIALASSDFGRLITVNMDTLIEVAGNTVYGLEPDVLHLHGRHDAPETIMTTISQYLDGLAPSTADELAEAICDKTVLAIGWSGRDRDVVSVFREHPPRCLIWVTPRGVVAPEVVEFHDELRARGSTVDIRAMSAQDVFAPHVSPAARAKMPAASIFSGWTVPERAAAVMRDVDLRMRVRAAAIVMQSLGLNEEVIALYRSIRLPGGMWPTDRKLIARMRRRLGQPKRALLLLLQPPRHPRQFAEYVRNANEVAVALTNAGFRRTGAIADRIVARYGHTHQRLQARVRLARVRGNAGQLQNALDELRTITSLPNVKQTIGIGAYVDALTWTADFEKMSGDYDQALITNALAADELYFADGSQSAYSIWKRAELLLLSGAPHREVMASLDEAQGLADQSGDRRTQFWVAVTRADACRGIDLPRAAAALAQARGLAKAARADGRLFLTLQEADDARVRGETRRCLQLLRVARARRAVNRIVGIADSSGPLAARFIAALARLERNGEPTARQLRSLAHLAADYRRLGMKEAADRCARLGVYFGNSSARQGAPVISPTIM